MFNYVNMCVSVCLYAPECLRKARGMGSPKNGVTSAFDWESLMWVMGMEPVLRKSSASCQ